MGQEQTNCRGCANAVECPSKCEASTLAESFWGIINEDTCDGYCDDLHGYDCYYWFEEVSECYCARDCDASLGSRIEVIYFYILYDFSN